jgi:hypothetical protein
MIFPIGPMERTIRLRLPALFAWKNMHPGKSVKSNMKSKYDELVRIFISIFAAKNMLVGVQSWSGK